MNNFPIKMMCKYDGWESEHEVLVYDFMHDTAETFQSLALCWVIFNKSWLTIPVGYLEPILNNKILNEG